MKYELPSEVADLYVCICGAKNCKLWRGLEVVISGRKLYCATCAMASQGRVLQLNAAGEHHVKWYTTEWDTNQIGMLFPAIPNLVGPDEYVWVGRVSKEARAWWRSLPTYPVPRV